MGYTEKELDSILRAAQWKGICMGIGWAYADNCCDLDSGVDPRKKEVPAMLHRAKIDLGFADEK